MTVERNSMYKRPLGVLLLIAMSFVPMLHQAQNILINELMASNTIFLDEDGDSPDWFELYNPTENAISLENWTVTDDYSVPDRWTFPNISLPSNAYLQIWASNKDRSLGNFPRTLLSEGDLVRYLIPTSAPDNEWRSSSFDDGNWPIGELGLGYGDGDDATVVPDFTRSLLIRKSFQVASLDEIVGFVLDIDYDDGFVAYLNGTEIARSNIEGNFPPYTAFSTTDREAQLYQGGEPERFVITGVASLLQEGENTLSIQVHNSSAFSSDLSIIPWFTAIYSSPSTNGTVPPAWFSLPEQQLHTNFKLSSAGETLYLFDEQGSMVDSLPGGQLPTNHSIGRPFGQTEVLHIFDNPTPAAQNPASGFLGALEASIVFSTSGGTVSPFSLSLSGVQAPARIHYTLDADEPSENDPVYGSPINIDENTVVRARIFRDNYLPSPIQTETYLLDVQHDLPIISLVTEADNFFDTDDGIYVTGDDYDPNFPYFGSNFWEDWERPIHFSLYETNGSLGLAFDGGVKIFGGWSRGHEQRSLSIFARSQYGINEINYALFPGIGYDNFQAFVLRNSGNDWLHSNFRDAAMTGLMKGSGLDIQAYRPAVTYLNGEFWGIYNIREKINEHFLATHHQLNPDDIDLVELEGVAIHGSSAAYQELIQFVENYNLSVPDYYNWVADRVDIDNYIQYQVAQIYFDNTDWPGNNIKFWKHPEGKWRWILFDTDFGFGIWNLFSYFNNTLNHALDANGPFWPNPPWSTLLFRKLVDNTNFRHQFINQFADEMNSRFLPARVCEHIDTLSAAIANEIPGHYERWGGQLSVWQEHVNTMKVFGERRPPAMKDHILSTFSLVAYHPLTISNNTPERGWVQVNSLQIEEEHWTGDYFQAVPIKVQAIARPGYVFSHWGGHSNSDEALLSIDIHTAITLIPIFEEVSLQNLVINEINYNSGEVFPTGDWIEIYNPNSQAIDLSNWLIKDDDDSHAFVIPVGTTLPAEEYLVITRDLNAFQIYYPDLAHVLGNMDFGLSSNGDVVRLFDSELNLQDRVAYLPDAPWPEAANGQGPTLELINPTLDNSLPESWTTVHPYGSPGRINVNSTVVNEAIEIKKFNYFPNPSRASLSFAFTLERQQRITVSLFNASGELEQKLLQSRLSAGHHQFEQNLEALPSGLYFLEVSDQQGDKVTGQWIKI